MGGYAVGDLRLPHHPRRHTRGRPELRLSQRIRNESEHAGRASEHSQATGRGFLSPGVVSQDRAFRIDTARPGGAVRPPAALSRPATCRAPECAVPEVRLPCKGNHDCEKLRDKVQNAGGRREQLLKGGRHAGTPPECALPSPAA